MAIASLALLSQHRVHRVLVIDLDVHQGDGTAEILANEPRVFTFSMHGARNYPMRKEVSDFDLPLEDGLEDASYIELLDETLPRLLQQPDLVFYNAGVDPHQNDRLGRLSLSDEGLKARDALVIQAVRSAGIPLCGVIGGGYSCDVDEVAARHAILFETAAKFT